VPILEASGIRKHFGGVVALAGAQFALDAGEVHALIGSNGCGKSTLCKIIAGSVAADGGRLTLDGRPVSFASPREAVAAGIGVFYQDLSLIPEMTVAENLSLGREPRAASGLVNRVALRATAKAALAQFQEVLGAGVDPDAKVADLSADQSQLVEILKVLAAEPRVVIFDEATAALDRNQVGAVFGRIRALKAQGRAVIFITHRMDEVFEIADRVTVMRNGMTVLSTRTGQTSRDALVDSMVGEAISSAARSRRHVPAKEVAMEVQGLSAAKLDNVSLALMRGEILGLGGLHGQGQSDLLRALFGALPIRRGKVSVDGQPFVPKGPRTAMHRSIAYVSGDRARFGVLAIRPIFENLVISVLARGRRWTVARNRLEAAIAPFIERLKLKFSSLRANVAELSGGNQQKVVIGRWLATRPSVLLLDDPTKGIDIQTKEDLYATMDELCRQGVSILLHSSDDEELLAVADRVLVFNGGRVVAELSSDQRTRFALYQAAYTSARPASPAEARDT
jgi:ribose transport system ATP-binding protein